MWTPSAVYEMTEFVLFYSLLIPSALCEHPYRRLHVPSCQPLTQTSEVFWSQGDETTATTQPSSMTKYERLKVVPCILNIGNRWMESAPRSGRFTQVTDKRMGGPRGRSGRDV